MAANLRDAKARIRDQVGLSLKNVSPMDRALPSRQICDLLRRQRIWKSAGSVLFFAPQPAEPDIWPLLEESLEAGKVVALPRFSRESGVYVVCRLADPERELKSGPLRIREPDKSCPVVEMNRLDLILVPGVAFDLRGGRLGRGKGYYDRLLAGARGTKCGVAFDEQIVSEIPVEPHDVRLNCILTPTRWIET